MNKDVLMRMGCCGSIVWLLATASTAHAEIPQPQTTKPENAKPIVEIVYSAPSAKTATPQNDAQSFSLENNLDQVGDLAINKLGCDCAGCRSTVLQMIQTKWN